MIWHSSDAETVLNELGVNKNEGLANSVAQDRLDEYGKNTVNGNNSVSFIKLFIKQLNNRFVYILFAVAIITFVISLAYKSKDFYSPILIIAIVLLNSLISAFHLFRCENAINTLKNVNHTLVTVLRDGVKRQISSEQLVPGDILFLSEGDYICADARLIETNNFRCNELVFTGDSIPVDKRSDVTVDDITDIGARINMVFSGCNVVHGTATAVVTDTGANTEIGHTSTILEQKGAERLPVQDTLDYASKLSNIVILVFCAIVFILSMIFNFRTSGHFADITAKSLLNAIALAVAAIPEGLPAISTVVVALGIERIVKEDILIKKIKALEVIGKTTVICTDKTGIITENEMKVSVVFDGKQICGEENGDFTDSALATLSLACACSTLDNDSTEHAIENACLEYNSLSKSDIDNRYPRLSVIPFDPERKTMTSINMISGKPVAIVKAAPEVIADKCTDISAEKILEMNEKMASDALRVIAVAVKQLDDIPANPNPQEIECDLTFAGLIGLIDPPRKDTVSNILTCDYAGIRTVMITGDNLTTAKAIARRIGILKDNTDAISGTDIAALSDEELAECISDYSVFARVTPEDKLRIVKALQSNGETVTITGTDVGDADALAAADTGCSMGNYGADVAKGNADIIIKHHKFSSIVDAIKESRGLFSNIQKAVSYLLGCNLAELVIYLLGLIIFRKPPLSPVQLLWINLLTDCAPVISLSMAKAEDKAMLEKPFALSGKLFDRHTVIDILLQSGFMVFTAIMAFVIGYNTSYELASTMAFCVMGLSQIFYSLSVSTHRSVFTIKFSINSFMTLSSILILYVTLFLCLTPAGYVFGLTVLKFSKLIVCLLLSLAIIPFSEILKFIKKVINP